MSGCPVRSSACHSYVATRQLRPPIHTAVPTWWKQKNIQDKTSRFTKAHIIGETTFLNNIFTTDALIFAPGSDVVTGRRSIEAINAEYVSYGISEFREEITALYGSGDYLISEGPYLMRYGKDNITEKGNYLNVYKQENDDWKLYANIWNTSAPQ